MSIRRGRRWVLMAALCSLCLRSAYTEENALSSQWYAGAYSALDANKSTDRVRDGQWAEWSVGFHAPLIETMDVTGRLTLREQTEAEGEDRIRTAVDRFQLKLREPFYLPVSVTLGRQQPDGYDPLLFGTSTDRWIFDGAQVTWDRYPVEWRLWGAAVAQPSADSPIERFVWLDVHAEGRPGRTPESRWGAGRFIAHTERRDVFGGRLNMRWRDRFHTGFSLVHQQVEGPRDGAHWLAMADMGYRDDRTDVNGFLLHASGSGDGGFRPLFDDVQLGMVFQPDPSNLQVAGIEASHAVFSGEQREWRTLYRGYLYRQHQIDERTVAESERRVRMFETTTDGRHAYLGAALDVGVVRKGQDGSTVGVTAGVFAPGTAFGATAGREPVYGLTVEWRAAIP